MKIISFLLLASLSLVLSIQCSMAAPATGNPNGIVTLVEYYDYECPHCRRMERVIDRLQRSYPELRVVHRVTPLLTKESYNIARFTLSVQRQAGTQAWQALHQRLMQSSHPLTLSDAQEVATELDLNTAAILKSMQQSSIQQDITNNITLAERHAIAGHVYLPILVLGASTGEGQVIALTGEQPYDLLFAIVQQLLDNQHVRLVKALKKIQSPK